MKHLNLWISSFITFSLGYFLVVNSIGTQYPNKELFHGAEIRFENLMGVRITDYILKKNNQEFLIAPNAPNKLRVTIQFSEAGDYLALVKPEYPAWLCGENDFDRATVLIQGGSLNKTAKLIRGKTQKLSFGAAKGQSLKFVVRNTLNSECGRALVTFYKVNNTQLVQFLLAALWLCIFALCFYSRSSPYVVSIGLLTNILLFHADTTMGELVTNGVVVNTGLSVFVVGVLLLISAIPFRSRIIALIVSLGFLAILFPAISFIGYERIFSVPFSTEAVHGAMQSYSSQMVDFWIEYIGKKRTLFFIIFLVLLYTVARQVNQGKSVSHKAITFAVLLVAVGSALFIGRIHDSKIYNLLLESLISYRWEIDAFKAVSQQRKNFSTEAQRSDQHKGDTTVVVFGESVNKKHMSAYGYVRQTTPLLDERIKNNEVVRFNGAYSNHTHSNPTMSMMLTQANQYGSKSWQESPSIFNYAQAAGVPTQWLTNHRLLGGWSNNITTIIRESDRLRTINYRVGYGLDSTNYDPELLPFFRKAIQERPNQLTLLHIYNSHSFYCNRYPSDFSQFEGPLSPLEYGDMLVLKRARDFMVNCYDNTIFYADLLLEEMISDLDERDNPSVLMYVADHAEEPLDGRTHNSAVFTFDMVNIPLVIWANKAWRTKHANKWEMLKNNRDDFVTNDLMFESVLGLAGIVDSTIDTKNDISSKNYAEPLKPVTLYGRVALDQEANWNYWQSKNIRYAKAKNVELTAVDIESIGEAKVASFMGIKRLRLNITLTEENGLAIALKGRSKHTLYVEDFLDLLKGSGIESLSVHNVDDNLDSKRLLIELNKLQARSDVNLSISGYDFKPLKLSDASFAKQLDSVNRSTSAAPIFVTISTRYTLPPPEPVSLN